MSFHSWLQNLRSVLAPRRGQRQHRRSAAGGLRAATYRPNLEVLEDRCLLAFLAPVDYPVDTSPLAVVTGDFNNDGHLDLATANPAGSVSVLLGDGAGGFGAAIIGPGAVSTPDTPGVDLVSLAVADFNNDGNLDLAMAVHGVDEFGSFGGVGVLLGNGDGTFQAATYPFNNGAVSSVVVGDFNNDGNSDLVVSVDPWGDYFVGHVELLPGNGQGGFTWTGFGTIGLGGLVQAVGDLNRDGNLDVVMVAGSGGGGDVLQGNGAGLLYLRSSYYSTTPNSRAVAVGDFTGDGIPDLVVAGDVWYPPNGVDIVTGRGDGTFYSPIAHSANGFEHTGVAVADFNGDGKLDAVTSDADTGTVSELLGNGNGTLTYAGAFAVGSSPMAVAVGDFNGDGRMDVATANAGSNSVSVLLNDGTWTPPPPPPPALRIGDRTITEGNTGTASATFTVTLSAASTETITVAYATGNGSATAGSDYQSASGTLTFAPGETSKTITVWVTGDRLPEPTETFVANLSLPTNAIIADGQGVGTIMDDEPRISISDASKSEGKNGQTTLFTFTVTLSAAYDQTVTMSFRTVNGTATTGNKDYVAKTGTLTFAPGETTKTITIEVKGDSKREANETFYLDLFGASSNALFLDALGLGTILNDD